MTLREWLLFVHIFGAIIWVGGSLFSQLIGARASMSGDPERVLTFARDMEIAGRVFTAAGLVVLGAGVWLVIDIDAYEFSEFWISAGLTVVIISAALGAAFYGPRLRKAFAIADEKGAADPSFRSVISRIVLVSQLETVLIVIVVALMVFKPGA